MSKKQAAWWFFGVIVVLNLVFIFITIQLWLKYMDEIVWRIWAMLLIIPAIPIYIWVFVAMTLCILLKMAVKELLAAYHTSIAEILF